MHPTHGLTGKTITGPRIVGPARQGTPSEFPLLICTTGEKNAAIHGRDFELARYFRKPPRPAQKIRDARRAWYLADAERFGRAEWKDQGRKTAPVPSKIGRPREVSPPLDFPYMPFMAILFFDAAQYKRHGNPAPFDGKEAISRLLLDLRPNGIRRRAPAAKHAESADTPDKKTAAPAPWHGRRRNAPATARRAEKVPQLGPRLLHGATGIRAAPTKGFCPRGSTKNLPRPPLARRVREAPQLLASRRTQLARPGGTKARVFGGRVRPTPACHSRRVSTRNAGVESVGSLAPVKNSAKAWI